MNLIKWSEEKIKKMEVWDLALLKTAVLILGVMIGAYISEFVKLYLWYFVGAFVLFYGILLHRTFGKK